MILKIIFWISFVLLAHTYLLYPLLLKLLAALSSRRILEKQQVGAATGVSVLIPAYNEEKIIRQKLESVLFSDYPKEKLEILVGSDACTDKTNELVRSFPQVRLVEFPGRSGKPKIINDLVKLAKNEILILTDANVIFERDTISALVKHFQNPEIALVDSNMINISHPKKGVSKAESTYIRGEAGIKHNEGKLFGKMMGPFGGCYALRKTFYVPVPENFLVDDFYINMKVLEKGGKAISEVRAKAYEEVPADWKVEFKRKIRIATGSFQNLFAFLPLLFRFNTLSFCFYSHKVLRWKGPFLIIALYLTNLLILLRVTHANELGTEAYLVIFFLQNLLLFLLIFDLLLLALKLPSPARLVTHFFSTNLALLIGFFKFLGGVKSSIWQPTSRA